MKIFKRTMALVLTLVMVFSIVPVPSYATESQPTSEVNTGDVTIEGTNGFGTLLSQEIQESQEESSSEEDDYEGGYSVTDLTFEGTTATVEYSSLEDAILVVALYSEDGLQLLTSGKTTVTADATEATVTIEGTMPEYFSASAYLVDTYDLSPLCAAYDTPMYTQEMQELLASTVDDYDPERVLNLDEDETTNFAVYADETIVLEGSDGVNTVALVDDENSTYVIMDADETVTGLKVGDVFVYPYGEGEILIVKVATIEVDSTTVTITGAELEMEEVFSHVKISDSGETEDFEFDDTSSSEGVTLEGILSEGDDAAALMTTRSIPVEHKMYAKFKLDHTLDETQPGIVEGEMKLTGTLNLSMGISLECYSTPNKQHVELRLFTEAEIEVVIDAEVKLTLPLVPAKYKNLAVEIGFEPEFIVEVGAEISFKVTIIAEVILTFGWKEFEIRTKGGYDGAELSIEGTLFVGIDLNPVVKVAKGYLADLDVEMPVGLEIKGTLGGSLHEMLDKNPETRHDCLECLDIGVSIVVEYKVKWQFLKSKWLKWEIGDKITFKLRSMYLSLDNDAFGVGECPYKSYQVVIGVMLLEYLPDVAVSTVASDGSLIELGVTDENGLLVVYLPAGKYKFVAEVGDSYLAKNQHINKACKILLDNSAVSDGRIFHEGIVDSEEIIDNAVILLTGRCGDSLFWDLDNKGRLFISGTGPMWNCDYEDVPWYSERSSITSLWIGSRFGDDVTSIGAYAFYDCDNLTSVGIPEGVISIGDAAFMDCEKLYDVSIADSVTTIGADAFFACTSLASVEIPDSVTSIGDYAFVDCKSLTSVEISAGMTTIGDSVFWGCKSLTSVEIPDSVTSIGKNTFLGCDSLTNVEIPDSVTSIGDDAFWSCDSLTKIIFRGDAPVIGCDAYAGVKATAYYPAGNATWTSDVMKDYGGTITWVPYTLDGNGNMIIDEATAFTVASDPEQMAEETEPVDIVIENADEDAATLDAVYGGDYSTVVTDTYTLRTASFSGLVPGEQYVLLAMVSIDVEDPLEPDNLLYIDQAVALEDGTLVFRYVQRIPTDTSYVVACGASSKNLNDAVITFPEMIADGETQIVNPTVVYDGKTLTEGQDYTIQGTVSFTEPGTYTCYIRGVRNYSGVAECKYTVVKEVASGYSGDIEWTLSADGVLTFFGNGEMGEYATSEETGGYALVGGQPWLNQGIEITSVVIEEGVTSVGSGAFVDLTTLTSVTFPKTTLTRIEPYAFYCSGLSGVIIPDGVTTIGEGAFEYCNSLKSVSIGNSVTTIGQFAFNGCSNLSNVEIPDSLTTISFGTFMDCTSLKSITIGNGVTTIENCAFYGCSNLISVIFGSNLKKLVGNQLFEECTCLREITFRGDAPTIGSSAFKSVTATAYYPANNPTWTTAVLQNYGGTITWEGYICTDHSYEAIVTKPTCTEQGYTTYICSVCSDSYVDSYVDDLGHDYSDGTCTRCGESDPNYESPTFGSCGENLTWTLSDGVLTISGTGSMTDYPSSSDVPWNSRSSLITTVNIGDSVTTIGDLAFSGCTNLTRIEIPDNATSIGYSAFKNCTSLTSVTIPDNVTIISTDAFRFCSKLRKITFTGDAPVISELAFNSVDANAYYPADNLTWTEDALKNYGGTITWIPCVECVHEYNAVVTAPTCTEGGYTTYTCAICGDIYTNDETGALGHSYDAVVTDPTCTEGGHTTYTCTLCGDSYITDETEAWGHSHDAMVTDPTCTEKGYTTYLCSNCGDSYVDSYVDALDHNFVEGVCTRCGIEDPNWDASELSGSCGENAVWTLSGNGVLRISGTGSTANYSYSVCAPWNEYADSINSIIVEEGITRIGGYSFYGCKSVTDVSLPDGLQEVGYYAFHGCQGLDTLNLPDSVTSIQKYAFYACSKLTSIAIPENVVTISSYAFANCRSVETLYFNATSMADLAENNNAFDGMSSTAGGFEVIVGANVQRIPANLMYGSTADNAQASLITKLSFSEGSVCTTIGTQAFKRCTNLCEVTFPERLRTIEARAFHVCESLTSLILPESLETIGDSAFYYCTGIQELAYMSPNLSIGKTPFGLIGEKSGGVDVTFGEQVEHIPDSLFSDGSVQAYVKTVMFSGNSKCQTIGADVFCSVDTLTEIEIPSSVKAIGSWAFEYCYKLEKIHIDSVDAWCLIEFEDSRANPLQYGDLYLSGELVTDIDIPDGIESIGNYAFYGYNDLSSVNIPDSVTTIGCDAFYKCTGLTNIVFPDNLTEIGEYAFTYCTGLSSVVIPDSVTAIGRTAFAECSNLTRVVIGKNVASMGVSVFYDCSSLTEIVFTGNAPEIGDSGFKNVVATAYYPADNETWIAGVKQNYGGTISWVPYEQQVHEHSYGAVVTAPTCTEAGYTTYTCSVCGDSYTGDATAATGHDYTSVVTVPTCTEDGYTTYTCSVCGDSYADSYVAAYSHGYVDGICTRCGEADPNYNVVLDYYLIGFINGADYGDISDWENLGEYKFVDGKLTATFTQDSYVCVKASDNAHWYMTEGYDESLTSVTLYNTASGLSDPNKLFVPGGVEITFTLVDNGDDTFTLSYTTPEPELFDIPLASMTMGNSLAINFAFPKDSMDDWTGCYAEIIKTYSDGREDVVVTIPYAEWKSATISGKAHYYVTFNGIAAKEMADVVYVTIYNADGTAVSTTKTDSVRDQSMRALAKEGVSDAEKTMIVDMLNYGAAAQDYFGYGADDLANSQLSEEQAAYASESVACTNGRTSSGSFAASTVVLKSNIQMMFAFSNVDETHYAIVTFTNHRGAAKEITITGDQFTANGSAKVVTVDALVVADGRQDVTCVVYDANGTEVARVTDSLESYTARNNGKDELFTMMMRYSDSAYSYFHS